ncbi:alpha-2,8-sialyltransferase 8F-like isoform X2 [Acanthaster planci]|uniref:Alpha-2,8-sialyltransferase 8F-like isoform X2 n=1 Tax=Acanthaster planci TaxID=133434 RepID=A0A8B7ZE91_ACAPL|nr:alpha-2,8-sialyltransferase 8F-like isoform X2 [Acanthaster planci]
MADMKGYSSAKLFAVVCSFAIIGLMTSFYIVEDTFVPFYKRTGPKFTELSAILMASDSTSSYAKMMKPPLETPHDLVRNVSLHCKMVCSESATGICVPLDLAIFVYRNDTPTTNMTFKFQNYNPVVSIATGSNISDNSPVLEADRCSLEEHFPGVELIPRQGSCAVVGNSGILNNSSCGDFIDSHDFVIRANMGLIKGYEVDVGRTSNLNAFNRDLMLIYGSAVGSTRNAKKRKIRNRFLNHIRTLKDSILWYPKQLFQFGGNFVSGKRYRSIINSIRKNGLLDIRFAFSWKPVHVEKAIAGIWSTES